MDAVLFLKEKHRMCKSYGVYDCSKCELSGHNNGKTVSCGGFVEQYPEEAIAIVEKWSKENPINTKKDEFFKRLPNAPMQNDGYPYAKIPLYVGLCKEKLCCECQHDDESFKFCWDLPYEGDD